MNALIPLSYSAVSICLFETAASPILMTHFQKTRVMELFYTAALKGILYLYYISNGDALEMSPFLADHDPDHRPILQNTMRHLFERSI